jgi:hypothetical protein
MKQSGRLLEVPALLLSLLHSLLYYCLYYIACSKAERDEAVWAPAGGSLREACFTTVFTT